MTRQLGWIFAVTGCIAMFSADAYGAPIQLYTIDFETEDDFSTPLIHGQSVYSTPRASNVNPSVPFASDTRLEFGRLIRVSSTMLGSDGHLGPAIFDSDLDDNEVDRDADLLVGLGNVLVLNRDESPNTDLHPTRGLVFRNPNDEATPNDAGGLVIDFLVPRVHPISIDLIDVDTGVNMNVIMTDVLGRTRTYSVPENWTTDVTDAPKGYHTLNLQTLLNQPAEPNATGDDATALQAAGFNDMQVARLEVQIVGDRRADRISGGIDNLVFAIPEPGTALLGALAITLGYLPNCRRRYR